MLQLQSKKKAKQSKSNNIHKQRKATTRRFTLQGNCANKEKQWLIAHKLRLITFFFNKLRRQLKGNDLSLGTSTCRFCLEVRDAFLSCFVDYNCYVRLYSFVKTDDRLVIWLNGWYQGMQTLLYIVDVVNDCFCIISFSDFMFIPLVLEFCNLYYHISEFTSP